jgi:predicted P-loop ATPase
MLELLTKKHLFHIFVPKSKQYFKHFQNEQPRRKQRGINSLQPLRNRAASCGELDPL